MDERRERWLKPPEWLDPLAAQIDEADDFADVPADARPLVRRSAIMAAAAKDARLKNRTLTKLYNERPTWLRLAHEQLDRAVLAAYAATDPAGGWSEDWAAVWVDTGAGQPLPADHPLAEQRKQTDAAVLAALLRLNGERANPQPPPPAYPTLNQGPTSEDESLCACALRFDGHRYTEATGFDFGAAFERFVATGQPPNDRDKQMAIFFLLQRGIYKGNGYLLPTTDRHWWAIRELFLRLWQAPPSAAYTMHVAGWPWDELAPDDRTARAAEIEQTHAATRYDPPTPTAPAESSRDQDSTAV